MTSSAGMRFEAIIVPPASSAALTKGTAQVFSYISKTPVVPGSIVSAAALHVVVAEQTRPGAGEHEDVAAERIEFDDRERAVVLLADGDEIVEADDAATDEIHQRSGRGREVVASGELEEDEIDRAVSVGHVVCRGASCGRDVLTDRVWPRRAASVTTQFG